MWSWLKRDAVASPNAPAVALTLDELLAVYASKHNLQLLASPAAQRPGDLRSRRRGSGIELDSLGPYQPGDDVRLIDWLATARSGNPQVRRFNMEVQRNVALIIDMRPAMFFGSRSRLLAKAACLAATRVAQQLSPQQQLGWVCLQADRCDLIANARGRRARLSQLQQLVVIYQRALQSARQPSPDLAGTLQALGNQLAGSLDIVLFSDFSDCGDQLGGKLRALGRHRTSAVVVQDEMMQQAPRAGWYPVRARRALRLNHIGRRARQRYESHAIGSRRQLRVQLANCDIQNVLFCAPETLAFAPD